VTPSAIPQEPRTRHPITGESQPEEEPETWHPWMALSSAITLVLGIALLASSHGSAGGTFFGILFLLVVIAGTVVTGFWFHYDHLESWQKGLAKAAYYPGGAFGIVALWIMKTINIFVG
jgi:hypothetical protein